MTSATPPISGSSPASSPAVSDFPRVFARTRRFSLGVPGRFTVSPDGARVLFVRTGSGTDPVGRLWLFQDGAERLLADPVALGGAGDDELPEEERVRRERARVTSSGITGYAVDRAVRLAVFTLGGALWAVRTDGGAPWRVPTAGPAVDPRPSPDGSLVAYVTGGALRVVGTDGLGDRPLAVPEAPDVVYGLAEHVAAESMGRRRGYWWSPDGDALLVARVDQAPVARWYLADPADPTRPPRVLRYPSAGTANAEVSVHVVALDGRRAPVRAPAGADAGQHPGGAWTDRRFEYVTAAGWDAHGPYVQLQTRDQRTARVFAVDPATGSVRSLHLTCDEAWVALTPGTPLRTASGAPVVAHVRDGVRGIRVGGVASPPGLQVREVLGAVGERVYFTGSEEPTETHVWVYDPYDPEGGAPGGADGRAHARFRRVSGEPGVHTAAVGGDTVVLEGLSCRGRSVTVLRGGRPAGRIAVLAEAPPVRPRAARLSLGEREVRAHLHLPSWHDPASRTRLPVLLSPYGGPGLQLAVRAYGWWSTVAQWFAEQGFAVLLADGRGTPGRGRDWEVAVRGDRLGPALEDQVDALHAAAERYPALDLGRVAIRGWSYGGYLAIGAVLHRPDVFHAAVAGAAPTDRRLYDTHWEERFLGHPDVEPENYARSSLVPQAHRLARPLMLVHGLADDNVVAAHTLRLSAALLAAGKPHTVLPLPGATHMVTQEEVVANHLRLEAEFLKRSLGG
ncbi:prolyl oligopeptidase family serine peptidase [Streptomyces sp. TRM76323]|uniref:Prolyl oligopeptidase family serine peptidase n=1 Tax=Streptomyces tamarix TaxID=3078565 RepID=A0ABU3QK87_9ACTN|nr:prolyl oligopeptidase family serine peptidase [Streptomyces tamarix]MDT9683147.1 prolyl oligopeptidase family serine peptidase [Streptomyces tamarix]